MGYTPGFVTVCLFGASVVHVTSSSIMCSAYPGDGCSDWGELAYTVAGGTVSLALSLLMILAFVASPDKATGILPAFSAFQLLWWVPLMAVSTWKVETTTGNFFFSSWLGLICAAYLAHDTIAPFRSVVDETFNKAQNLGTSGPGASEQNAVSIDGAKQPV